MHIALITPLFAPYTGGVEQHVAMLARQMLRHGHRVQIITTDPTGKLPSYEERYDLSIRRFRSYGRGAFYFAPALASWLRRHRSRFDVLHAHSYHQPLIVQAAVAADRAQLVVTTHYHAVGHTPLAQAVHRPYRPIGRWALHRARRVISVSDVERAKLVRDFGRLPIVSIPNGVDVASLLATPRPTSRETTTQVLSVGRLEPYKQPMRLVEAVPYLPESYSVAFVGDGTLRSAVHDRADQLGVGGRIDVRGRVSDAAVREAYRAADVFVTLSLQEAFGLTLLEAAVAGAAVVASDIAPHQEVGRFVPDGRIGFVAADGSPADVAESIVRARQRGRVEAQSHWPVPSWEFVAEQTLQVYSACAQGSCNDVE